MLLEAVSRHGEQGSLSTTEGGGKANPLPRICCRTVCSCNFTWIPP